MDYTVTIHASCLDGYGKTENVLEYIDDGHIYLVDGIIVPSITQILSVKFGNKYSAVDKQTLSRAAEAGTAVHEAIEAFCMSGKESDLPEVRNFKFLSKKYKFDVLENEVPVILYNDDEQPLAAGRLDLVLKMDGKIGGADIKRVSSLDKEYLAYQLNLYRIAYFQCYDTAWEFLRGIQLRDDVRKFVEIPINPQMAWELVDEYFKRKETKNE